MPYLNFGDITPAQIQIFLAAAETENFSQAAAALHITQPHVSHTVAALEALLGFPLFTRSGKKVRLTQAGRVLFENWRGLFSAVSQGINLAYQAHLQQNTGLVIADKSGLNKNMVLYPLIRAFKARQPSAQITIQQFSFAQGLEAVAQGKADIGFCLLSEIQQKAVGSVSWRVLSRKPFLAFVPPGSPVYDCPFLTPELLAPVPILLCDPAVDPHYNEDTLAIFQSRGLSPTVQAYAKDGLSLMLSRGISDAVIILSPFSEENGAEQLRPIPIQGSCSSLVLYWNNQSENSNIESFVRAAPACFQDKA